MIYAATGNAGPAFGDQPSRASQMYTTVQRSEQHERAGFSSFLYQAVAKILVLVRGLWVGLVFDDLAAVAPSQAGRVLPLIAQPLSLGRARRRAHHLRRFANET